MHSPRVYPLLLCIFSASLALSLPRLARAQGDNPAPRVGPGIDRLAEHLHDARRPEAERKAYWQASLGTLVSGKGEVLERSGSVLLDCPPENGKGPHVFVRAVPDPQLKGVLDSIRMGEKVTAQGRLVGDTEQLSTLGSSPRQPVRLQDARIVLGVETLVPARRKLVAGLIFGAGLLMACFLIWLLRRPLPQR